ncbi:MAG: hypothetical protein KJ585_04890 [Alphaproteobacteria bacterium]|nr:hypothetical protein [Alphaproteobacteria bacterium]
MTLKTSLIITSDTKAAKAEIDALRGSVDQVGGTVAKAGPQAQQLEKVLLGVAVSSRDAAQAAGALGDAVPSIGRGAIAASNATDKLTKNVGLQRAGFQQLGYQLQDISASYASGARLSTIFAQQSGQLSSAIALIAQSSEGGKGKLAGLASFLGGPWGIAIGIAVSAGTALASSLFNASEAAEAAKLSTSSLSDNQSVLGSVMDITTGKMKAQTGATLALALAQAQLNRINAQKAASEARTQVGALQNPDRRLTAGIGGVGFEDVNPGAQKSIARDVLARLSDPAGKAGISTSDAVQRLDNLRKAGALTDDAYAKAAASVANFGVELENVKVADATIRLLQGKGTGSDRAMLLKPDAPKRDQGKSGASAAKDAERLAGFSAQAAESVARLSAEFDNAPRDIDRAGTATRSLDKIINDVNARMTSSKKLTDAQRKGFADIADEAARLKPIIADSLQRPIRDMLDDQQRQIALGAVQLTGRQSEADALNLTFGLMRKVGAENEDQLATELAKRGVTGQQVQQLYDNLEIMRQQTREMEKQRREQQAFLGAIGDMRENTRLTLQDLRQEGPKALADFAKRSVDVFDRLFSEVATEKLFGGLFRDLEDQITGGDKVSKAGARMAAAVDNAAGQLKKASSSIGDLGDAAASAAAKMRGESPAGGLSIDIAGLRGLASKEAGGQLNGAIAPAPADIVVTALKRNFKTGFEGVFDDLNEGLKGIFTDIFGDRGLFSKSLGETMGRTFGNAALGGSAGGLATGLLGIKGSGTGGMLGGALGGAIGKELLGGLGSFAGPFGAMAGGVLGSALGGLLKKTKSGAANITSLDGAASLSGNSSKFKAAAGAAAGSVQEGLASLADQLGGVIGGFNVTIGQRHGDWRVRTGTGSLKVAKGAKEFDDDQAGAIAYAIQLAVSQGAVTGLSSAVDRALKSSPDLDKAVSEALKVQDVETLLGGIGNEMAAQFKGLEKQAKERVRIATQYGFDVVAIEKKNAEDRVKLVDDLLSQRVGSLQSLLDEMNFGNLAEGSVMDQRTKLMAEINKARGDAEAGVDGAAEKLASLSRSLIDLSREKLGTAGGEYSSDRNTITSAAQAVIAAEKGRISAAQGNSPEIVSELKATRQIADEQADQLSKIGTTLDDILVQLSKPQTKPNDYNPNLVAIFSRQQEL